MVCEFCKKDHDGSYGSGRFCSGVCARAYSTSKDIKKTKIVNCITCGQILCVDKRASDKMCKCDICRKEKIKKSERINRTTCIVCGDKLKENAKKYCSVSCSHKYYSLSYIDRWKRGLETGSIGKHGDTIAKPLRRYLFDKFDSKCSRCGWNEINPHTNRIPLQVEHIDGNHLNNSEDNLTLLCPNCHSLTSTFGGANIGKGRKHRLKSSIISEYVDTQKLIMAVEELEYWGNHE